MLLSSSRTYRLSQALINENHGYLVTLGVSHPSLEAIRKTTADPYGLSTKLTGAGGGGCAVTLIPDGTSVLKLGRGCKTHTYFHQILIMKVCRI